MSDTVIKVENLSKQYRLGTVGTGTISHDLNRWWAKVRGKEDPTLKLGETNDRTSKGESEYSWALKDINFNVKRGEVLGIIGHNGAGKSTLLKILSRVTGPTTGELKMKGRVASLLEVGTGFHPELTGRENIFLNGAIMGMTKAEIRIKIDEIVDFSGCSRYLDTPVKRYSSGMKVRLGFAVAAHLEPEILVVDEVLAVGDMEFQKKCLGKMKDVAGHGRTVLFVSHNMAAVQQLCSRAVLLKHGLIHTEGDVGNVINAYYKNLLDEISPSHLPPGTLYLNSEINKLDIGISSIQMVDQKGSVKESLHTWDYVKFRISYCSKEYIKKGSVVFKVSSKESMPLILCSTEPDHAHPYEIQVGEHYVDLEFSQWPLTQGNYILGAGLASPGIEYICWDDNLAEIDVLEQDIYQSGLAPSSSRYLIATEHKWIINVT